MTEKKWDGIDECETERKKGETTPEYTWLCVTAVCVYAHLWEARAAHSFRINVACLSVCVSHLIVSLYSLRKDINQESGVIIRHRVGKKAFYWCIIALTSEQCWKPEAELVTLRFNSCCTMTTGARVLFNGRREKKMILLFFHHSCTHTGKLIACHFLSRPLPPSFPPSLPPSLLLSSSLCLTHLYDQSMGKRRREEARFLHQQQLVHLFSPNLHANEAVSPHNSF